MQSSLRYVCDSGLWKKPSNCQNTAKTSIARKTRHLFEKSRQNLKASYSHIRQFSCHLCLHACNRSVFARGLSIDFRAYVISQHVHWPIRAPLPTCANQDAWVVITPNSIHTPAWHDRTRTPPLHVVQKAVFSLIHFPASFICLWPSCHFNLGDRGMAGGCS